MGKKFVYQGYVFNNKEQMQEAKKEATAINYLREKSDFSNMNNLLKLYDGILNKNMMKTVVGIDFLKEIREKLIASGMYADEEIRPLPKTFTGGGMKVEEKARNRKDRRDDTFLEECEKQNKILKLFCIILAIFVVILFIIIVVGIRSLASVYDEMQLVEKYAVLAQQLQETIESEKGEINAEDYEISDYIDDTIYENETYEWMIKADGTVEITGYYGTEENKITIPKKLDGKTVTGIGEEVFLGCTELTSISIPDCVTSIGAGAFSGCSGLTSISLPKNMTEIADYLFAGCECLTKIVLPDNITRIGVEAFSDCYTLMTMELPKKLTEIGEYAFYGCAMLRKIILPSNLMTLEGGAFAECTSLEKVEIPNGVTSLESEVFYNCSALTLIIIPKTVQDIDDTAFIGCDELVIKAPNGSAAAIFAEENGYELK